jgi:hypothetical protein
MSKQQALSYHVNKFSDKVRTMNDTNSKELLLTATEARSLHTDIFALLSKIAVLTNTPTAEPTNSDIVVTGGKF